MQDKRYLLDLRQLFSGESCDALFQEALDKVDAERREKALRMKKFKVQAASLGAGLLLQKAFKDSMNDPSRKTLADNVKEPSCKVLPDGAEGAGCKALADRSEGSSYKTQPDGTKEKLGIQLFSVRELLMPMEGPVIELDYGYGGNGKPYFKNYPLKFNLSHSGEYVFCGVSDQEIGVDIQEIKKAEEVSLAKRFFSERECQVLEHCGNDEERRQIFFRMWARKEAYGKLTGQGVAGAMKKNLWTDDSSKEELLWEEYNIPAGYCIAVCKSSPN